MKKNWLVTYFNKNYFLKFGKKLIRCQIGLGGLQRAQRKIEGDKTTPIGKWLLKSIYYRPDKSLRPKLKKKNSLKINQITKYCGWCDDIRSNYYNKYIRINNSKSVNINYEKLWRKDNVYDIIITTSHNINPTIKNKGSGIFIHCSYSDKRNTAGCVAIKRKDLVFLLRNYKDGTYLTIKN